MQDCSDCSEQRIITENYGTNKEEDLEWDGKQNIPLAAAVRYPPLPLPSHVLAIWARG